MPGHPLLLALAAAAAVALGAASPVPAATPAEPGPAARGLPAAAPAGGASGAGVAGLPDGAAAAVNAPTAPAAAAPPQGAALAAGAAGPPGAAPAPGHGWRWPLAPAPRVLRRFDVGPFPWSPGHRGVDLGPSGAAEGAAVLSAGPGVVRFAGRVAGRGVVSVDHGSGIRTTYEPVTAAVRAGDVVAAGQPLGTLAAGHCTPTACLHWGALFADRYVDPLTLLRPREPPVLLPVPAARVGVG